MKIALDLDGVCFDFTGALHAYSVKHRLLDPSAPAVASTWDFFLHEWGWSPEEFAENICDAIEFGELYYAHGFVYPGVHEGVAELRRLGHTINIITDRARFGAPGLATGQTFAWLDREGIEFDTVTFARDKAAVLQADIAFDDAVHHWKAYRAAGTICVLRDQPYNQEATPALRTPTFDGFVQLVDGLDHRVDIRALHALYASTQRRTA